MAILKDFRSTKTLTLPNFPGSSVEIYSGVIFGDIKDGLLSQSTGDIIAKFVELIPLIIKSWNFTDEEGKDLPITKENINKLGVTDIEFLAKEFTELVKEQKKK